MPVNISINRHERIYINPFTGQQIPRLTKGLTDDGTTDLGDGGEPNETGEIKEEGTPEAVE